jgi:serine protease
MVWGVAAGFSCMLAAPYLPIPGVDAQRRATTPPLGRAIPRECAELSAAAGGATASSLASASSAVLRGTDLASLPGEVLVKFRAGTSASSRNRALGALRGRPVTTDLQWSGPVGRYRDPFGGNPADLASQLARQPEVEYAQPNYIRRVPRLTAPAVRNLTLGPVAQPSRIPSDPDYAVLQWNFSLINAPGAWDISPGGKSEIIVAVLDTGVTTAPALMARPLWTGQAFDSVLLRFERSPDLGPARFAAPADIAFEPGGPMLDFDGHGTHVASTIAEDANNQISLAGLAYNVRIMPVKVCVGFWEVMLRRGVAGTPGYVSTDTGGCADADIAAGIRYAADNGAHVINLSLGGAGSSPVTRDAIAYAVARGAFVAAAVGNAYERGNQVEYPAGYAPGIDGVMSVGAVGKSRARSYYSNTGTHLEIVAPGGSNRDTDAGADLGYIWQVTLHPPDSDPLLQPVPRFDRYVEAGYIGTSMATAHVSALAALLMSQGITSPQAVEAAIKATAQDLGSRGRDDEFGWGLIQARAALFGSGVR